MRQQKLCLMVGMLFLLTACASAQAGAERPGTKELSLVTSEGKQEAISVSLWQEEEYSLYLPEEGWSQDQDGVWRQEDANAALFVGAYPHGEPEALWETIVETYTDYGFLPLEDGSFTGYDGVHTMTMWVRLIEGETAWYAVCAQYPTADAGTLGACLRQLAETFRLET